MYRSYTIHEDKYTRKEKQHLAYHEYDIDQLNKLLALYTYRSIEHICPYTKHNKYYFLNISGSTFVLEITVYKLFMKLLYCTIFMTTHNKSPRAILDVDFCSY